MNIGQNKVVELTYELNVEGQLKDRATAERPLDYIQGTNMLLPKFEENLEGKQAGDTFEFTLTPEEAYGEVNPSLVLDLPKSAFMLDGKMHDELLVVGKVIPMLNNLGSVVNGTVKEVKEEFVSMDFNHPLAGQTLVFTGQVLTVREATEKELKEGLHGEYLPQEGHHCCGGGCHKGDGEGCGGGCEGGCGGGCGGDCNCKEN